jgi:hypothetical protein
VAGAVPAAGVAGPDVLAELDGVPDEPDDEQAASAARQLSAAAARTQTGTRRTQGREESVFTFTPIDVGGSDSTKHRAQAGDPTSHGRVIWAARAR